MKKFLIFIMALQVLLFLAGVVMLVDGKIYYGLFNIGVNTIFFFINLAIIRMINGSKFN